jgi:hypothetical protein
MIKGVRKSHVANQKEKDLIIKKLQKEELICGYNSDFIF